MAARRPGLFKRWPLWARNVKRDGLMLWFASRHPATPLPVKLLCLGAVAYALSPIDLIPDFIPVLGLLDDMVLLPVLIWLAVRLLPSSVLQECRADAEKWMTLVGRKPRQYAGIVLVVGLWAVLAYGLWRWLG